MKPYAELITFQNNLFYSIRTEPITVMDNFKKNWADFSIEDKRVLGPMITAYCEETIKSEPTYNPQIDESNIQLRKLCAIEIRDKIKDEIEGRPDFGNLKLSDSVKIVDIAVVFKLLYDFKYFENTLDEISQIITRLFELPDKATIPSYMNDNSKLQKAAKKFKLAIDKSNLINK